MTNLTPLPHSPHPGSTVGVFVSSLQLDSQLNGVNSKMIFSLRKGMGLSCFSLFVAGLIRSTAESGVGGS
jgi:hypothetical protein